MTHLGLQLPSFTFAGVPDDRMFERIADIAVAVDGCGVACFALPLRPMALAYTRLDGPILEAMVHHPELVADLPAVRALIERAVGLDEGFEGGALHEALIVLDAMPLPEPGPSVAWTLAAVAVGLVVLVAVGVAVRHLDH